MTIQTLSQRFDSSYPISKTMAPQSGGHTDFRNYCNNISEFETFATTVQEIRQEGLITYELSTKKTKRCKKSGSTWTWEEIPTTPEVQALIQSLATELQPLLTTSITSTKEGSSLEKGISQIWVGTQADYDAITTKSDTVLYFIK